MDPLAVVDVKRAQRTRLSQGCGDVLPPGRGTAAGGVNAFPKKRLLRIVLRKTGPVRSVSPVSQPTQISNALSRLI